VKDKTSDIRKLASDLEDRNRELEVKNRELSIVSRLKGEFLHMMSHELNTPLNVISGFAQLLQQNEVVASDPTLSSSVGHILSGADRLIKAVSAILSLSDMTAGNIRPTYSTFSSDDLLSSVESDFPRLADVAGNADATLRCEHPEQSFDLTVDSGLLQTAINHLLDNGIKFGGGSLVLGIQQDSEHVRISITDSGKGMTKEEIDVALEPLRQVDGSTHRNVEGIGMGLALVKGITQLHGGQLIIESVPGEGTAATISLPLLPPVER